MLTEAYSPINLIMKYYGNGTRKGAHYPFNFNFVFINYEMNSTIYKRQIDSWNDNIPDGEWGNWVVSIFIKFL